MRHTIRRAPDVPFLVLTLANVAQGSAASGAAEAVRSVAR